MQTILGLAIIIAMVWPAIKFLLGIKYGIGILIVAILVWRACLK